MKKVIKTISIGIILIISFTFVNGSVEDDEKEATDLLKSINELIVQENNKVSEAEWKFATNITDATALVRMEVNSLYSKFEKEVAMKFDKYDVASFKNKNLKRQIKKYQILGDSALSEEKFNELLVAISNMESVYSQTKIPSYKDDKIMFSLEPEISESFGKSEDPKELEYYWKNWYDNVGTKNKKDFFKYVELRNEAAQLNSESFMSFMSISKFK